MSNAIVVIVLLAAAPAFADQSSSGAGQSARFGALRPQSDPYKKLFEVRQGVPQALDKKLFETPKVVCGMTLVPGDPSIDPKMRISPKTGSNLKYTIRAVDPPICNPSR